MKDLNQKKSNISLDINDDELKNFIETDSELSLLNFDSHDKVLLARQIMNDRKENSYPGYILKIKINASYWSLVYVPTKEQALKERRMKSITIRGEDSRDYKASLQDFYTNTKTRSFAKQKAEEVVKGVIHNIIENPEEQIRVLGLYLHSPEFQIGKTYLANAISNELADSGISGVFVFTPSLATQARKFENLEKIMRELKEADILVLDDLGAEYRSEWFRLEVLMPVLQNRLSNLKTTIITSNYSPNELKSLYRQNTNAVDVERLLSRILELCRVIQLDE